MTDYSSAKDAQTETPGHHQFDTIPVKHKNLVVEWRYPEFQSLCPVSERHDQGTVMLRYKPKEKILESKSMRDYLMKWRNKKNWQESITGEIAEAVYQAVDPEWLCVEIEWAPRGGIFAKTTATRGKVPGS